MKCTHGLLKNRPLISKFKFYADWAYKEQSEAVAVTIRVSAIKTHASGNHALAASIQLSLELFMNCHKCPEIISSGNRLHAGINH